MNRNYFYFLFILLVISAVSLIAQQKITLRLVDWASANEIEIDKQTIDAFHRCHPDIEVLYEPNPGPQYEAKFLTGLVAGEPPDVFLLDSKLIPTFTNKNILLDLNQYIGELGIDTSQWFSAATNIARRDSFLFAFPKGFSSLAVYFNKKLFDDAGVPYPSPTWNWDDYQIIAEKLTKDINNDGETDQYGTAISNHYYSWIPWLWSAGGDVVDPSGKYSSGYLNSKTSIDVFQFLIDLRLKSKVAPEVGTWVQEEKTGAISALFANGKIAMMIDGHWRMPRYLKFINGNKLDIGVAPFPFHPSGRKINVLYESGWCVPVLSKHKREAVTLAAFMAGEEACRIRAEARLEIPANIKAAKLAVDSDATGMTKVFLDELPFSRQPWGSIIERFSEIEWTLQDALDEALINEKQLSDALSIYSVKIDKQLTQIRSNEGSGFKPIREHSEILYFLIVVSCIIIFLSTILYSFAENSDKRKTGTAILFLTPSIFHLTVFLITPIIFSFYLSVHHWDIVVPQKPFVGFQNYVEMFNDRTFWNALTNTLLYSINVPFGMAISLFIANMLHKRLRWLGFIRTIYFLPSVTSFVAIALVWMWIYHPSFGIANYFLNLLGIPSLSWLNSTSTAMISIIIFNIWLNLGYQMVIFLAGLQGIPDELYDASRVDGASAMKQFWKITFPLLMPTTFFILVTSLIGSFQVFTTVYIMTSGGPVGSTDVIVYHIYHAAWEQLRMGYASAIAWILFVIIMVATWIQFKFLNREIEY